MYKAAQSKILVLSVSNSKNDVILLLSHRLKNKSDS